MPQIQCPHCGQPYQITDEQAPQYAGQTITCTQCRQAFTVPAELPPAPVPPPTGVGGYAGQGHTPGGSPQTVPYGTPYAYRPQQTSGLAIAALVCACLGFIIPVIPSLLAIVLGIMALQKTRDPSVGGKGLAIAGICVGAFSFFLSGCMLSVLLPSLNRARETANRVKCASNMRQIGQAILLYSNDHRGAYPPTIDLLLTTQPISHDCFVCPSSNDTPPPGGTPQQQAQAMTSTPGHLSYVYVGAGMNNAASPEAVVLYEQMTNHRQDGINVLYGDGHVEWQGKDYAQHLIQEIEAGNNPPRPPGRP